MVNNFSKIIPLLRFPAGHFYFVQILQRKKDHNIGEGQKVNGSNNNSRLIKAYYIDSFDKMDFVMPEIIEMCNLFNARAGINMNLRSYEAMAFQQLKKIADQIMNREYEKAHRAYNSVCGLYAHDGDKTWIIDIDSEADVDRIPDILMFINTQCEPFGEENKHLATIPSKHGFHVLTRPFNMDKFKRMYPLIEVHKNNPTNLFIP